MKRGDMFARFFLSASTPETAQLMFDSNWNEFMRLLSYVVERALDTKLVQVCIDGFKYMLRMATRLGDKQVREGLSML